MTDVGPCARIFRVSEGALVYGRFSETASLSILKELEAVHVSNCTQDEGMNLHYCQSERKFPLF